MKDRISIIFNIKGSLMTTFDNLKVFNNTNICVINISNVLAKNDIIT